MKILDSTSFHIQDYSSRYSDLSASETEEQVVEGTTRCVRWAPLNQELVFDRSTWLHHDWKEQVNMVAPVEETACNSSLCVRDRQRLRQRRLQRLEGFEKWEREAHSAITAAQRLIEDSDAAAVDSAMGKISHLLKQTQLKPLKPALTRDWLPCPEQQWQKRALPLVEQCRKLQNQLFQLEQTAERTAIIDQWQTVFSKVEDINSRLEGALTSDNRDELWDLLSTVYELIADIDADSDLGLVADTQQIEDDPAGQLKHFLSQGEAIQSKLLGWQRRLEQTFNS